MSSFDDEFGLFGDDEERADEERRPSALGARQIASGETIIDDIEPEDERPARRRRESGGGEGDRRPYRDRDHGPRSAGDPAVAQARAVALLEFLAKRLVSRPDDVIVAVVDGARGPIIELEVHPDDFGKVIGKGGRVAQALRTLVRASAEGKVSVDIVDVEDDDELEADAEHVPPPPEVEDEAPLAEVAGAVETVEPAEAAPKKKTSARKKSTTTGTKRKKSSGS